jgi:hypothetical protein
MADHDFASPESAAGGQADTTEPLDIALADKLVHQLVGRVKNHAAEERVLQAMESLYHEAAKSDAARDEVLRMLVRAGIEDACKSRFGSGAEPSDSFVAAGRALGLDPTLWWGRG